MPLLISWQLPKLGRFLTGVTLAANNVSRLVTVKLCLDLGYYIDIYEIFIREARVSSYLRKFLRECSGTSALTFSLAIVPVLAGVGASVTMVGVARQHANAERHRRRRHWLRRASPPCSVTRA